MKITDHRLSQFDSLMHFPEGSELIEMVRELRELRKIAAPEHIDPVEYLDMIQADWAKPLIEQLKLITGVMPYHLRDVPMAAAKALEGSHMEDAMYLYPDATQGPWGLEITSHGIWVGPLRKDGKVSQIVVSFEYGDSMTAEANKRALDNANLIVDSVNGF